MNDQMLSQLAQYGVAGILVLMLLDKVFGFLKSRKDDEPRMLTVGDYSVDAWKASSQDLIVTAFNSVVVPLLRQQLEILKESQLSNSRQHELLLEHGFILNQLKLDMEKLRTSSHNTAQAIQAVLGRRAADNLP